MQMNWRAGMAGTVGAIFLACTTGCPGTGGAPIDIDDILNLNRNDNTPDDGDQALFDLDVVATNTGGASGIALRPSDGALFLVNADGLFGPIVEGADVSSLVPFGATNLATLPLFDIDQPSYVLAITNSGEFWIASPCCTTLAVVPPEGGDAAPFDGLSEGVDAANIAPDTMVIVPDGFEGPQMRPGNLLVGEDTTFSRLAAIDVEGDRTVVNVSNPLADADPEDRLSRQANHLTFSPDGVLFSGRAVPDPNNAGIQTIAEDGTPAAVAGTFSVGVASFVARPSGDLVIRGAQAITAAESLNGILIWSAAGQEIALGVRLPPAEISAGDEMIATPDGDAIFLSLPLRNQIVRVVDAE